MGSEGTKTIEFQDESNQQEKRSPKIIALEEKKDNGKLKRKKDSTNTSYGEDGNDQNFPTKKMGPIYSSPHIQMTASIQDGQYYPQSGSTSQTHVSYVRPEKHILESILDILQRNDPDELFAKPVNPNGVDNYYKISNTPLDFAAIRAKINEELYISMEAFKFDVYLLCFNAMYANDKDSRPYQVAEAIQSLAVRVFEDISVAGLQRFNLESLPTNAPIAASSRIPQVGPSKILGHARFRHILPPGGGRQHNTSALIPQFVDKIAGSSSKDVVGVGASSSQIGIFPSQDANFARRVNPNNSFTSQSNQHGIFQGLVSPSIISFNQTNEISTFPVNSYSDLQMKLGLVNPMGPFPMLQHSMSSSSGPIPQVCFPSSRNVMRGNVNQSEEVVKGKEKGNDGESAKDGEIEEVDLDLKL